jgi:uncharacterized protein YkwD
MKKLLPILLIAGTPAAVFLLNVGVVQPAQAAVSDEVIQLVNQARSQGRVCGSQRFGAARPLSANGSLNGAAQAHSSEMAARNNLTHTGANGSSVGDRAKQAGYQWRNIGENIGVGYNSGSDVVKGWLNSPGHCANIMNPNFQDSGVSVVKSRDGKLYWTMVYGKR